MATNYKCDICGKPATVHITRIINNKKIKVHLCSECAEKASLDSVIPSQLFPKIQQLEKELVASNLLKSPGCCPNCGTTLSELEKGARFSCPHCYETMGRRLLTLFSQLHGAKQHTGKTPKFHSVYRRILDPEDNRADGPVPPHEPSGEAAANFAKTVSEIFNAPVDEAEPAGKENNDVEYLKAQLENAIKEERYEDAAKLRDKLKSKS